MRPGVPALPLFSLGGFLVPSVAPALRVGVSSLSSTLRVTLEDRSRQFVRKPIHTFTSFRDTQFERDGHNSSRVRSCYNFVTS